MPVRAKVVAAYAIAGVVEPVDQTSASAMASTWTSTAPVPATVVPRNAAAAGSPVVSEESVVAPVSVLVFVDLAMAVAAERVAELGAV